MKGDLEKIARELLSLAANKSPAPVVHSLARGLKLVCRFNRGEWWLKMVRAGVEPSATEIATCLRAFHVPPDALSAPMMVHASGERSITYTWTGPAWPHEQENLL